MHKKYFPIPTFIRFIIILQLCFGLCCTLWFLGYPFSYGYFKNKSDLLLIEAVLGIPDSFLSLNPEKAEAFIEKSRTRSALYLNLPHSAKNHMQDSYQKVQLELNKSFFQKFYSGALLLTRMPLLEMFWVILAVAIPILLLFRIPQALLFMWLLPLVALAFALNNQINGTSPKQFFPSEKEILALHKGEIENAWNAYLVSHWAHEIPSQDPEDLKNQVIKGEFYFNLDRAQYISRDLSASLWEKRSPFTLLLYVLWNLFFVIRVAKQNRSQLQLTPS